MAPELRAQVFIVEDDPDVRGSLRAVITALGYDCRAFDSAESLLRDSDLTQCDCLLVDFNLPGMKGTELITKVRESGSHLPSALCTGQADEQVHAEAERLGNTLVVEKGDEMHSIATCLRTLLSKNE